MSEVEGAVSSNMHSEWTPRLIFAVLFSGVLSSWQFGYNTGVLNPAVSVIQSWINDTLPNKSTEGHQVLRVLLVLLKFETIIVVIAIMKYEVINQ